MQRNCCHVSFAFILKSLNFLQAFIGVSVIIYSIWMLDRWNHHVPVYPPAPSAPSPDSSSSLYIFLNSDDHHQVTTPFNIMVSGFDDGLGFNLNSIQLPAPWYSFKFWVWLCFNCIEFNRVEFNAKFWVWVCFYCVEFNRVEFNAVIMTFMVTFSHNLIRCCSTNYCGNLFYPGPQW